MPKTSSIRLSGRFRSSRFKHRLVTDTDTDTASQSKRQPRLEGKECDLILASSRE